MSEPASEPSTQGERSRPYAASVRLHVADAAVASIAAATARRVPGVAALHADLTRTLFGLAGSAFGRARPASEGVDAVVSGDEAEVAVTLVTRLGNNCRDLAAAVQQAVTLAVTRQTGLAAHVEVTIAEVLLD